MPLLNIDQTYDFIKLTLMLENARPLYDGITDLRRQLSAESEDSEIEIVLQSLHLRKSGDELQKVYQIVKKLIFSAYNDNNLIRQNPNYGFLAFWKKRFNSSPMEKDNIITISNMLLYYDLLNEIIKMNSQDSDRKKDYDDLPYLYENLCGYIQKIMKCRNSYIIHQVSCGDTHIIARSAYLPEEVKNATELKSTEVAKLLIKIGMDIPNSLETNLGNPLPIEDDFKKYNYLFIPLYTFNEEKFYILLQYKKEFPETKEILKILFAREHLKFVVFRDYEHLLNLRYELGFVRFFREPIGNCRYPIILHTSDLHADIVNPAEKCLNFVLKNLRTTSIDLLVLSGDIVDAQNSNASQTQDNYEYAARIIRRIVSTIWKDFNNRISFDWKRRIMFVPGNHDFAAMNLVKAVFKQRSLAAGIPYDGNNKIVAKFAYYLHFVQELLDAPIDQLIRNEINEVREYRRMNTKVLMLNSSYDASSVRTNKVRVNEDILIRLTDSEAWQNCSHSEKPYRLCIVHHPPFNSIDYTLDGYDAVPGWDWNETLSSKKFPNKLYIAMKNTIQSVEFCPAKGCYIEEKNKIFSKIYVEFADKVIFHNNEGEKNNKYYFTKDAKTLYDYYQYGINNEYAEKLISEIKFNILTAEKDTTAFKECIDKHLKNADLILCGHVHTKNKFSYSSKALDKKISIVGKLLVSDDKWNEKKEKVADRYRILRVCNADDEFRIEALG